MPARRVKGTNETPSDTTLVVVKIKACFVVVTYSVINSHKKPGPAVHIAILEYNNNTHNWYKNTNSVCR